MPINFVIIESPIGNKVMGKERKRIVNIRFDVSVKKGELKLVKYFPMFVNLEDKKVVVVGGGKIAERRVKALLEFGCSILVISKTFTEKLEYLEKNGLIECIKCAYPLEEKKSAKTFETEATSLTYERSGSPEIDDIWLACAEAYMVLAATNQREVNHQVYLDAKKQNQIVNVCDAKEECDFYFPGLVTGERVVVGVTASGVSHRLAKEVTDSIREKKEEIIELYEKRINLY